MLVWRPHSTSLKKYLPLGVLCVGMRALNPAMNSCKRQTLAQSKTEHMRYTWFGSFGETYQKPGSLCPSELGDALKDYWTNFYCYYHFFGRDCEQFALKSTKPFIFEGIFNGNFLCLTMLL